ncbi:hypothetical protein Bca52824_013132 [Brassica carinata]|uniref:UAS domain-containing protein n=1 Tax=Brassica carinata TaxID=52824 RepID=A0A8X7VXP0_BRACI|nr:hypothetical protein Bca52824_013132 [Brassica carinata]
MGHLHLSHFSLLKPRNLNGFSSGEVHVRITLSKPLPKFIELETDDGDVITVEATDYLIASTEFSSHMLNRDTWANEAVSQTIKANFIFWQVYESTTEGSCTSYKVESIPVILVIDPTTGQKMRMWCGMSEFCSVVAKDEEEEELQRALAASLEDNGISSSMIHVSSSQYEWGYSSRVVSKA